MPLRDDDPLRATSRRLGNILQSPPRGLYSYSCSTGGGLVGEVEIVHPVPRSRQVAHLRQLSEKLVVPRVSCVELRGLSAPKESHGPMLPVAWHLLRLNTATAVCARTLTEREDEFAARIGFRRSHRSQHLIWKQIRLASGHGSNLAAADADGLRRLTRAERCRSRIRVVCEVIVFDSGRYSRHTSILDAENTYEWIDVESGVLDGFYTVDGEVLSPSAAEDGIFIRLDRTGRMARAELASRMATSDPYPLDCQRGRNWDRVPPEIEEALARALSINPSAPGKDAPDTDWTAWVNLQDVRTVLAGQPRARHTTEWLADLQAALDRPGVQKLMGSSLEAALAVATWIASGHRTR